MTNWNVTLILVLMKLIVRFREPPFFTAWMENKPPARAFWIVISGLIEPLPLPPIRSISAFMELASETPFSLAAEALLC